MNLDITQLTQAIEEFNSQDYFACHETLEALWLHETNHEQRLFLQGWLQVAVGLYHAGRSNPVGTKNKLSQGLVKLEQTIATWEPLLPNMPKVMTTCKNLIEQVAMMPRENSQPIEVPLIPRLYLSP